MLRDLPSPFPQSAWGYHAELYLQQELLNQMGLGL